MSELNLNDEKKLENTEHHAFDANQKAETPESNKNDETKTPSMENLDDEKFPWLFAIISIFLAGIVAIIIYLAVSPSKAGDTDGMIYEGGQEIEEFVLPENADQMNLIAGKYYPPYKLKNLYEGKGWTGDQTLLNQKNEVVIESMAAIFPELKGDGHYLSILGQAQGADFIILEIKTEDKNGTLYKFRVEDLERKEIAANAIYKGANSKNFLSDNQRQMIMVPANNMTGLEQKIYLISLLNGSYTTLLELKGNETFNGGWEYDSDFIQGEWLNAHEFSIAVFDQSKKEIRPSYITFPYVPSQEYAEKIFMENRIVEIK